MYWKISYKCCSYALNYESCRFLSLEFAVVTTMGKAQWIVLKCLHNGAAIWWKMQVSAAKTRHSYFSIKWQQPWTEVHITIMHEMYRPVN